MGNSGILVYTCANIKLCEEGSSFFSKTWEKQGTWEHNSGSKMPFFRKKVVVIICQN